MSGVFIVLFELRLILDRYPEWPDPRGWIIFQGFFMEFVDLAPNLPQEKYETIRNFRKQRVECCWKVDEFDPLLIWSTLSSAGDRALAMSASTADVPPLDERQHQASNFVQVLPALQA